MLLLDHVSISVADLTIARPFYDALMGALGVEKVYDRPDALGYGVRCWAEEDYHSCLAIYASNTANQDDSRHWCFKANTRLQVDLFHAAGLVRGGRCDGPVGMRPAYHAQYYAAFLYDPSGNRVEAVCHRAESGHWPIAYVNQPSELHSLLTSCDLPVADVIVREGLFLFAIRDAQGAALATIGLELCGEIGLLRSLAVAPNQRQRGLAARLVTFIEQLAQVLQLPALYLLTISAAEYFQRHGYQSLARENTPPAVQQSRQFRELCPEVAQVLYKLM